MLKFVKTRDVKTPKYSSEGAAGLDIFIPNDISAQKLQIDPHKDIKIPMGLRFDIPKNFCLLAVDKSGISTKQKLLVGAKLIDEDFTGIPSIHLINTSTQKVFLQPGQKIIQLIYMPYYQPILQEVKEINKETERGSGGFGSTGLL